MQIRKIDQSEARAYFECLKSIDQETKFMMFEPDERQFDEDLIVNNLSNENDLFLGVFNEHEIVGFLVAKRGNFRRIRHSAYIVIGIRHAFQGQGIKRKTMLVDGEFVDEYMMAKLYI